MAGVRKSQTLKKTQIENDLVGIKNNDETNKRIAIPSHLKVESAMNSARSHETFGTAI